MRSTRQFTREGGFTIVELMIALSILSVLLVTSTIILIQIGALYSKGVNAADLQNATRTVVADISGQLQFSGKVPLGCTTTPATCYANVNDVDFGAGNAQTLEPAGTVYSYCIGNTRYTYVLNRELGTDTSKTTAHPDTTVTPHVLWRDTLKTDATACPVLDIAVDNPSDSSTQSGSGYEMLGNHMRLIRFKIEQTPPSSGIYGVDVWTAFGDSDLVASDGSGRPICVGGTGSQFCSTATITTQLTGRIY